MEVQFNTEKDAWMKTPMGMKQCNDSCENFTEKKKPDNFHCNLKFMRKFHCLWHTDKEKVELKLEEWMDTCDITMNKDVNNVHEKKMTMNDTGKMKRCTVRLTRTNPEVTFEVSEGKMKNVPATRAWKAVSEFVEDVCNPNVTTMSKGTRKNRKNQNKRTV